MISYNLRRLLCPLAIVILFSFLIVMKLFNNTLNSHQLPLAEIVAISPPPLTFEQLEASIENLLDPQSSSKSHQHSWNNLMSLWKYKLSIFMRDSCQLCDANRTECYETVNIDKYVSSVNDTYYPRIPIPYVNGIGLYYYFDMQLKALNNSILSVDTTQCDYFHMIQLMINIQIILYDANIKHFLTKGTLIGTLRHHDVIPWDTDIDLFIPAYTTKKLLKMFHLLDVRFTTTVLPSTSYTNDLIIYPFRNIYRVTSYKIFSSRSKQVNGTKYRWPKIDLFPYYENKTHLSAYPKHRHNL
ncbi:unnamed protein product, partial [Didymodactylos carnosus]